MRSSWRTACVRPAIQAPPCAHTRHAGFRARPSWSIAHATSAAWPSGRTHWPYGHVTWRSACSYRGSRHASFNVLLATACRDVTLAALTPPRVARHPSPVATGEGLGVRADQLEL